MADHLFDQADQDGDNQLSLDEFRNFIGMSMAMSARNSQASPAVAQSPGPATFSSEEKPINFAYSDLEQEAFGLNQSMNFEMNASSLAGIAGDNVSTGFDLQSGMDSSQSFSEMQQTTNEIHNQRLYHDPNPQIIRRPAQGNPVTYTQNIQIRFLQPPPPPPPGPLIIREVRPPQPPPLPPLRIRQQAPPLPQPPPLILRERPPPVPESMTAKTVIRNLPPLPVPPRSVIIERIPPLPPKPRDIIIERWIPYEASTAKRKTIVQPAEPPKPYPKPRNIIIEYEPITVRVTRQFENLGVVQSDPQAYLQRYGNTLLDGQTLIAQARAAGVVEDLSPPTNMSFNRTSPSSNQSGRISRSSSGVGGYQPPPSPLRSYHSPTLMQQQSNNGFSPVAFEQQYARGDHLPSLSPRSNSSATMNNGQTWNQSFGQNFDPALAAFQAADINQDGTLDENEFRLFLNAHLR